MKAQQNKMKSNVLDLVCLANPSQLRTSMSKEKGTTKRTKSNSISLAKNQPSENTSLGSLNLEPIKDQQVLNKSVEKDPGGNANPNNVKKLFKFPKKSRQRETLGSISLIEFGKEPPMRERYKPSDLLANWQTLIHSEGRQRPVKFITVRNDTTHTLRQIKGPLNQRLIDRIQEQAQRVNDIQQTYQIARGSLHNRKSMTLSKSDRQNQESSLFQGNETRQSIGSLNSLLTSNSQNYLEQSQDKEFMKYLKIQCYSEEQDEQIQERAMQESKIRRKLEQAVKRRNFIRQMKLNFLNSKKKKAAILYIQPIEYEDAGMMTANISIPAEDEVSPMKPTPFPKFLYYPQSKSIEMKSPSNVLDTIVDSSPKSDKGKVNKQQTSGQKGFQNSWEAPYEASPKIKKQMQESFLYLSEPPSKTTSMSVDTQIRTNRQSLHENLQLVTNQYPSTVILRKRTKQKKESPKITPYMHPQVKKPFKILKNPSPFEGHAQLSKSQDLEHIVRKKKQNNDTAQDQLVIQRMMSYLRKHQDSVKISESASDATPLNESELISKFNNFDEISEAQKTIDLRQSVRQWGQQTLKLNILEPRLPFMSANRKQLERILSETKQSRQEKIFTNLKRVQDSRKELNSSVVTLASPSSQEELHPYVGISKGRGQVSTQLLGNLFINTEHSSKKSVLFSKSSVPSQQSDNAGGIAIFSRRIECVQNRKNNRSIGLSYIGIIIGGVVLRSSQQIPRTGSQLWQREAWICLSRGAHIPYWLVKQKADSFRRFRHEQTAAILYIYFHVLGTPAGIELQYGGADSNSVGPKVSLFTKYSSRKERQIVLQQHHHQ